VGKALLEADQAMGLDIYVGSLSRYYAHDWETVIQRQGREQGIPVVIQRANETEDAVTDPATIRELTLTWRFAMSAHLRQAGVIEQDLEWSEDPQTPYFTDKPGECFAALQVLAAYEERGKPLFGATFPKTLDPQWQQDSVWKGRVKATLAPRYSHLYGIEFWLPADFSKTFEAPSPAGKRVWMGSVFHLLRQLEMLNERTYMGAPAELAHWRLEMPVGTDANFEPRAKTGMAIMLELASAAARERLPIVLDY